MEFINMFDKFINERVGDLESRIDDEVRSLAAENEEHRQRIRDLEFKVDGIKENDDGIY